MVFVSTGAAVASSLVSVVLPSVLVSAFGSFSTVAESPCVHPANIVAKSIVATSNIINLFIKVLLFFLMVNSLYHCNLMKNTQN
jgi:hypothetical protein